MANKLREFISSYKWKVLLILAALFLIGTWILPLIGDLIIYTVTGLVIWAVIKFG